MYCFILMLSLGQVILVNESSIDHREVSHQADFYQDIIFHTFTHILNENSAIKLIIKTDYEQTKSCIECASSLAVANSSHEVVHSSGILSRPQ